MRMPPRLATKERCSSAELTVLQMLKVSHRRVSVEKQNALRAIVSQYAGLAFPYVQQHIDRAGDILRETGVQDTPCQYTTSTHYALASLLGELWARIESSIDISHSHRETMEKRIAELEARPVFEDAGVWGDSRAYKHGHGVTQAGSFWIAKRDTMLGEKPGASDAWRLAVKRGRDASNSERVRP